MTTAPTRAERAARVEELVTPVVRAVLVLAALVSALKLAGLPGDWVLAAFAFSSTWAAYLALLAVLRQLFAPRDDRFRVLPLGQASSMNAFTLLRRLALCSAILLPVMWSLSFLEYPRDDVLILLSVVHVVGLAVIALLTVYARGGPSAFLPPQGARGVGLLRRVTVVVFPLLCGAMFGVAIVRALGYLNLTAYVLRVLYLNAPLLVVALVLDHLAAGRIAGGASRAKWARGGLWIVVLLLQIGIWDLRYYHWLTLRDILDRPLFTVGDSQIAASAILRAVLLAAVAYVLARLMRVWVDRSELIRQRWGEGVRYAFASLSFYIIILAGLVWAMLAGGFPLNALTVFAGMAGIGLGFGLQAIVNNFVSGLILLIERPLAVGDFIDIGGVKGQVTSISLRSTVIRTPENVHILVPNGDLISQQVTNLSHRDLKIRLTVDVGVSYDSDVDQVIEVLLGVARGHASVLDDPEPVAWLVGFGDSSVDFQLHAWIPDPAQRVSTRAELYLRVWHALQRADIEIPFPQRDLHVRSADALGPLIEGAGEPDGDEASAQE